MLTLCPVLHRFFLKMLLVREGALPVIVSLLAVLDVIELLQGIKANATQPEDLAKAIKKHLDLFIMAYGKSAIRPKHHYVLHLAPMLSDFGLLLATYVHERKHRVIRRYTMPRKILKSWNRSVIEEVTCHSIWEMSHRFYNAFDTSTPQKATLQTLQMMFPAVRAQDFSLHRGIAVHGGIAVIGDVISFDYKGHLYFGELLLTAGIADADTEFGGEIFPFVSLWAHCPKACGDNNGRTFLVKDDPMLVPTRDLDACFIHRPADDGKTSFVLIPRERHVAARPHNE